MAELSEIRESIIKGNITGAEGGTKAAIAAGVPARGILHEGLVPAMERVGELFEKGEYFFPELLLAGEAMKVALQHLKPTLSKSETAYAGKFAIGTVEGDIHDIGKNVVSMFFEANGWEVTDLGIDVPSERFYQVVKEGDYHILGMSSLVTTTMPRMAETISLLQEAGLRNKVKVMIGGAPVTRSFADQIGADAYARDAVEAVTKAKSLIKKS